ncbi:MAG TPA: hypothetical protein VKU02_27670 [Gemmataceae bacterium]|nr:hypothetical protein [Gemmataceae bacterium]
MSVAVDFGLKEVVDGNWGIQGIAKMNTFATETICLPSAIL